MPTTYLICAVVTLVSVGYAIALVRTSTGADLLNARYAASRSIALVAIAVAPVLRESESWLIAAATAMIMVQAIDAVIGYMSQDRLKTWGPAITALANTAGLWWALSQDSTTILWRSTGLDGTETIGRPPHPS